ncbi:hypothetical protein [Novosphingobium soli]|uniref:Uncharacterized protein n=1 Tax=Novosphingobium soli TaxID=574956 RepID=A0ABV6D1N8_9SPHN
MTTFEILIGLSIIVLAAAGFTVSVRRNNRAIEAFEDEECNQLRLCSADWRLPHIKKKLAKLGWQLITTESQSKGHVNALFERTSNEAALPIREVLKQLNRTGHLSAGPLTLRREERHPPF